MLVASRPAPAAAAIPWGTNPVSVEESESELEVDDDADELVLSPLKEVDALVVGESLFVSVRVLKAVP